MDKPAILKKLETHIAGQLEVATQAAHAAHEAATHIESKPEDEYDTRGLEASYLAGAQSKRAMELEQLVALYRYVDVKSFGPEVPIASTAVVEMETNGKSHYYLLMPKGGGLNVEFDGKTIHVVTPQSPLGGAILGKKVGDQVEVEIGGEARDYDIVNAW